MFSHNIMVVEFPQNFRRELRSLENFESSEEVVSGKDCLSLDLPGEEVHSDCLYASWLPLVVLWEWHGGDLRSGNSPFRFENMWLKVEGFKGLVRNWWMGYNFRGSHSHILVVKLKALRQDLKKLEQRGFQKCHH